MQLASLFADHMVFQRNQSAPVWGWATAGESVMVEFAGQRKTAQSGPDGKWLVRLDPMAASATGREMIVSGDGRRVVVGDVLVGDVFLCSGQSNMAWVVRDCFDAADEQARANLPLIRQFFVPTLVGPCPPRDIAGIWSVCSPATVGAFTAVGYFFARDVFARAGVPIAILNSSWGGTCVEPWTSRSALMADPGCRAMLEQYDRRFAAQDTPEAARRRAEYLADPDGWVRNHVSADPGNEGFARGWAGANFDDSSWPTMQLPGSWQSRGVAGSGVLWFRHTVDLPADWAGRAATLGIGAADKHDETYVNGQRVGRTGWETANPWALSREYPVPAGLLRAGPNVIASRVYSYRNAGGLTGPATQMCLKGPGRSVALVGDWRYQIEHRLAAPQDAEAPLLPNSDSPAALYEQMIQPVAPFALCGFLWYQGESNAGDAVAYRTRFPLLIRDWRRTWGGDWPFMFVQLANYGADGGTNWPMLRDAQRMALAEPKTGMAVAIDCGDPVDIHPRNKQEVGRRLALAAEALVYGRGDATSGPLFESMRVDGRRVRVRFSHVGDGLRAACRFDPDGRAKAKPEANETVSGFELAGADGAFHPAVGRIEGPADVVVASEAVAAPVAVRYAWKCAPICNLYGGQWLAASPFRTDGC